MAPGDGWKIPGAELNGLRVVTGSLFVHRSVQGKYVVKAARIALGCFCLWKRKGREIKDEDRGKKSGWC